MLLNKTYIIHTPNHPLKCTVILCACIYTRGRSCEMSTAIMLAVRAISEEQCIFISVRWLNVWRGSQCVVNKLHAYYSSPPRYDLVDNEGVQGSNTGNPEYQSNVPLWNLSTAVRLAKMTPWPAILFIIHNNIIMCKLYIIVLACYIVIVIIIDIIILLY